MKPIIVPMQFQLSTEELDEAIEKANRLVELLREVQQIIDSLSGEKNSEA
nr:MAG TPA: hypothetical protein [Caudoviricetes sp.]